LFISRRGCSTIHLVDPLTEVEVRVLGSLIEKDITTPDYYPLSLNALVNACNQKNNREPVMTLEEDSVSHALATLQEKRLAGPGSGADSRVTKYEHRLQEVFNFDRREIAILCVLLLRGPQTPGELRSRADRLYTFDDLATVQSALERLANRPLTPETGGETPTGPLTTMLPRQPGSREARYAHLLGDQPSLPSPREPGPVTESSSQDSPVSQRLARMEAEIAALTTALQEIQSRLDRLESNR
jgi:uncharacterized protein